MRRQVAVSVALAVALGGTSLGAVGAPAAFAGAQAEHGLAGCYPRRSTTIAQDKTGRFYRSGGSAHTGALTWYVCAFKQSAPRKVGGIVMGAGHVPFDRSAQVSGRYVAFIFLGPTGFCSGSGGRPASSVTVIDMVTDHRMFSQRLTGCEVFPVTGANLVLKPDGSVAWVTSVSSPGRTIFFVHRHDSTGTTTVDSGPQIDPHSLAAGGSRLYWTNAGSPRSAPFR